MGLAVVGEIAAAGTLIGIGIGSEEHARRACGGIPPTGIGRLGGLYAGGLLLDRALGRHFADQVGSPVEQLEGVVLLVLPHGIVTIRLALLIVALGGGGV